MAKKPILFKRRFLLFITLTLSLLSLFGFNKFYSQNFKVVRVIDGDTIVLKDGRRVRYLGINAPEAGECFATEAANINKTLVLNQQVRLQTDTNKLDQFGRTLAYTFIDDKIVNQTLLEKGAAEYFEDYLNHKYQKQLTTTAENAHQNKSGLWTTCASKKYPGCNIKGNLDPNDRRFYHLPSFRHYNQVVMNLNKGDRYFCSEDQALKAGFKRARE